MAIDFNGKRVMVVEDDYLIAMELAEQLEAANAVVVGPCRNLEEADLQLAHSDLAVLDIDLRGVKTYGLADRLEVLDVPYIFFTGYDRDVLPKRFAAVDCITKLQSPQVAIQHLDARSRQVESYSIVEMIPMLRARARAFIGDAAAADRLVEVTLQLAIKDPEPMPSGAAIGPWLMHLMDGVMQTGHGHVMN